MIGKNFPPIFGKQKEQKGQQNKRRTKPSDNSGNFRQFYGDNLDNTGQLFQGVPPKPGGSRK